MPASPDSKIVMYGSDALRLHRDAGAPFRRSFIALIIQYLNHALVQLASNG